MATNGKPGTGVTLLEKFSAPLGLSPQYFKDVVKATVLKTKDRPATDEELAMFLAIADRYGLDVWTKQIHAFVDKGAIVPIVGIDGWNYLENSHPDFAYEEIEIPPQDQWLKIDEKAKLCPPWMRVLIFHKESGHPTDHTEYLDECYQPPRGGFNGPWQTHTKRMLRHKARIQAIREAFGYGGIFDPDEAQRIIDAGTIDYEGVVVEEDAGEVIGQAEYDAMLAEMERTQVSLEAIAKNVAAKAGYQGELADMPMPVWESLMAGLATMPTKTPPAAPQEPESGAGSAPASEEAPKASALDIGDDPEPPGRGPANVTPIDPDAPATPQQLAELKRLRKAAGINAAEFNSLVSEYGGEPTADGFGLTVKTAGYVVSALKERGAGQ